MHLTFLLGRVGGLGEELPAKVADIGAVGALPSHHLVQNPAVIAVPYRVVKLEGVEEGGWGGVRCEVGRDELVD